MCKCTPNVRTPFCGKPGCEWPGRKPGGAREAQETRQDVTSAAGPRLEKPFQTGVDDAASMQAIAKALELEGYGDLAREAMRIRSTLGPQESQPSTAPARHPEVEADTREAIKVILEHMVLPKVDVAWVADRILSLPGLSSPPATAPAAQGEADGIPWTVDDTATLRHVFTAIGRSFPVSNEIPGSELIRMVRRAMEWILGPEVKPPADPSQGRRDSFWDDVAAQTVYELGQRHALEGRVFPDIRAAVAASRAASQGMRDMVELKLNVLACMIAGENDRYKTLPVINEIRAALSRSQEAPALTCRYCANPATCIGRYEGHGGYHPACDDHCGHGNEDGFCTAPADLAGLLKDVNSTIEGLEEAPAKEGGDRG